MVVTEGPRTATNLGKYVCLVDIILTSIIEEEEEEDHRHDRQKSLILFPLILTYRHIREAFSIQSYQRRRGVRG